MNTNQVQASIVHLLGEASRCLAVFLEEILPPLFNDWWNEAVINALSFQQRRRINERAGKSLGDLDLAAMLRVLDGSWYQISTHLDLTVEARHFVKEMQTIRNRWAHAGSAGFPMDDVYRDLDTLHRFAKVIRADEGLLQEICDAKAGLLQREIPDSVQNATVERESSAEQDDQEAEFAPGQIVVLRSNPDTRGAVVAVIHSDPENRFDVFVDGEKQMFYASQLRAEDRVETEVRPSSCEAFHSYLTALQIRYPGLTTLYSLNAARIDFIPYQFRPVLKFIKSDRPRLLIADGVGVGKTIEAGLILRELQARRDIRSVLIICPRPLVVERKWQMEMKRFEEQFVHLDSATLRYCIDEMDLEGAWPEQYQRAIVPYTLFDETLLHGSSPGGTHRRRKGLLDLDPPPRFDLVIVDEAHHIRNTETFNHKVVRYFCDHAEAVLFLTATPIQLGSEDLFVLLNMLRPDLIIDKESFEHMAEPNPFLNRAIAFARTQEPNWKTQAIEALDLAAGTSWGKSILRHSPDFKRVHSVLAGHEIGQSERVQLITDLESLHTFSGIINRTRRRDIGAFTIRRPQTVVVEFTSAQRVLHDELLEIQAEIYSRLHGDLNVNFIMTTIRRQAASSLFGLAPFLKEILNRHLHELSWDEADEAQIDTTGNAVDRIESRIKDILEAVRTLDPSDPKLEALREIIKNKQSLPNNRVMLFSSFRHTLHYLYEHLKADAIRVGLIHGGTPDEDRIKLRGRFAMKREADDALDVLLFSEIGCEGLDYQFCDCMVNYDLPWNPMRIEQRIGRIDRHGQQSKSVDIFNLITPGTVDADIYERCLMRIGVFNDALGDSEEILGEITREIRKIGQNCTLNESERRDQLQQLADNKIRILQEQNDLEKKQLDLLGLRLPEDQMRREIEQASSHWLEPDAICGLIASYVHQVCENEKEHLLGKDALRTFRLSQDSRRILLRDFQRLPQQKTSAYRDWENWLRGGTAHLPVTFDVECAAQHPEAAFLMPLHPLVKQAALALDTEHRMFTALRVSSNTVPMGKHEFAVYQWQYHGIREDLVFQPVAASSSLTEHLPRLLETAETDPNGNLPAADSDVWNDLDAQHHRLWSEARRAHLNRTKELAEYRRESLGTSHRARMSLLEEQLNQATNQKIQTMRRSQIAVAEADYARHIQDLDIAMERADLTAGPVAFGVIQVSGDLSDAK